MSERGASRSLRDEPLTQRRDPRDVIDAPPGETRPPKGLRDVPLSLRDAPKALVDKPIGLRDAPLGLRDAPIGLRDAPIGLTDAPKAVVDEPIGLRDAPIGLRDAPKALVDAPKGETRPPLSKTDAANVVRLAPKGATPTPNAPGPTPIRLADYRARSHPAAVTPAAFRAFISRPDIRKMVLGIVKKRSPPQSEEDLAQDVLAEALRAFERSPPGREEVLVDWLKTIAQRVVADSTRKRKRRGKYEGDMPEDYDADVDGGDMPAGGDRRPIAMEGYDPRADATLEGRRVLRWLEKQVGENPRDRETLAIILEHGMGKKTYQAIADERRITLAALSSRVFEFKQKYIPRYRRERERTVLLLLLLFALGFGLLLWFLSRPARGPEGVVQPRAPTLLDQVFPGPLPVSHPNPYGDRPDGGPTP
ncbi:MAG TPA: sigma-70 family RNA polymerase sigma factor [Polyangiaceae bacterium]|nr:sigma-70 family RNA polymerase sigma factor [Polyangiaceae bacterium]